MNDKAFRVVSLPKRARQKFGVAVIPQTVRSHPLLQLLLRPRQLLQPRDNHLLSTTPIHRPFLDNALAQLPDQAQGGQPLVPSTSIQ